MNPDSKQLLGQCWVLLACCHRPNTKVSTVDPLLAINYALTMVFLVKMAQQHACRLQYRSLVHQTHDILPENFSKVGGAYYLLDLILSLIFQPNFPHIVN